MAHQNARMLEPCNSSAIGGRAVARIVASTEERNEEIHSVANAIQNRHVFFTLGVLTFVISRAPPFKDDGSSLCGASAALLEDIVAG